MSNTDTSRRRIGRVVQWSVLGAVGLAAIVVGSRWVADPAEQQQTRGSRAAGATVTISVEELEAMAGALDGRLQPVLEQLQAVLNDPESGTNSFRVTLTIRPLRGDLADAPTEPIRIGDGVPPPTKIHDVPPVYPPAARAAGIGGIVILDATIDAMGEVSNLEVLQSVPELDEAAIAAVEQWRYEPTLVDGVPVSVTMTMTISFSAPPR